MELGTVYKRSPQSGGGGLSSADIFRIRWWFRCGHQHFLVQKNFKHFEIYGICPHVQGESISRKFVQMFLWMGPYEAKGILMNPRYYCTNMPACRLQP